MAVSLSLLAGAGWQFLDDNANPLTGGLLYTYAAGTTTPLATYTSSSGSTPNTNPIVLDAAGRVSQEVWLTTTSDYKFILKNSAGVTIWTKDDIPGGLSSDAVSFLQAGTGAVERTAQSKMRDVVSVKDFGAVGDGVVDDTAAIQAAINAAFSQQLGQVFIPAGTYKVTQTITMKPRVSVIGTGSRSVLVAASVTGAVINSNPTQQPNHNFINLEKISITGTATHGIIWTYSPRTTIRDVEISMTATNGFIIDGSWGCVFENLSTGSSTISNACFWLGRDVNGCLFNSLYTASVCEANILSDNANAITGYNGTPTGHGVTINNAVCQDGKYGLKLLSVDYGGWTINSPYFEAVETPIKLGDLVANKTVRSITINSPFMLAPASTHGYSSRIAIDFNNVVNVTVNAPEFGAWGSAGTDLVTYSAVKNAVVSGFYSSSVASFTANVVRNANANSDEGITFIGAEFTDDTFPSVLLMKAESFGYTHYKAYINGAGAWVTQSVTPPLI